MIWSIACHMPYECSPSLRVALFAFQRQLATWRKRSTMTTEYSLIETQERSETGESYYVKHL